MSEFHVSFSHVNYSFLDDKLSRVFPGKNSLLVRSFNIVMKYLERLKQILLNVCDEFHLQVT